MATPPTVDMLIKDKPVIEIDSKTTIIDAFKVLVDNHILSAPIYNADAHKYVGFFDMCDFGTYLVETIKDTAPGAPHEPPKSFVDVGELLEFVGKIHPTTLDAVSNLSGRDEFTTVNTGAPLLDVLTLLSKGQHRVVALDAETGRAKAIVSQSAVLKFIADKGKHVLEGLHGKHLKDVGLGVGQKLVSVYSDEPVMKAFEIMRDNNLSGIPLMNRNGTVDTSISWTDLRVAVQSPKFNFRDCTALEFVQRSRSLDSAMEKPAVCVATPETSIEHVIGKLAATGLHRLFVVDGARHLVGVVSLKDILRYLLLASTE